MNNRKITHKDGCQQPGFRYLATVRTTKQTVADGTAGRVVMVCRDCGVTRLV